MDVYRTLAGEATAQITEKRSVFISSVRPVSTEDEAAAFVAEVQRSIPTRAITYMPMC